MFLTLSGGLGAAFLQNDYTIILILAISCGGLALSFLVFLLSIERGYAHSFFDTRRASTFIKDSFLSNPSDEQRMAIFSLNECIWREEVGESVKSWLGEAIPSWIEEQPAWFTDYKKSTIPDWALADKFVLRKIRNRKVEKMRKDRRRSLTTLGLMAIESARG